MISIPDTDEYPDAKESLLHSIAVNLGEIEKRRVQVEKDLQTLWQLVRAEKDGEPDQQ